MGTLITRCLGRMMTDGFFVEQINGVTIQTFTNSSEAAVNAWGEAFNHAVESTPESELFHILMDVSSPQVNFSRYARQTSQALFSHYRQRKGRLAFVFSSKTAPHFARIFFASLGKLQFELRFFSSREQAVDWLRETRD